MVEKKTGRAHWTVVFTMLLAFGFLALAFYNYQRSLKEETPAASKAAPIPVAVVPAKEVSLERLLETSGDLHPRLDNYVFPKVAGRVIEKILVDKGDQVKKGQLLVILDASLVKARKERMVAAVAAARSQMDVLAKDKKRLEFLLAHKAAPRQQLDRLAARYKAAVAKFKEAEAARREVAVMLADHFIKAGIDGVVAERFFDPGNLSDTKKPILRLSDESLMKIELSAPETYFSRLQVGMPAEFVVAAYPRKTFHASLVKMNPVFDPATRTIKLELQTENPGQLLRSGMYARVKLHLGSWNVLAIPREALNRLPGTGSYFVFIIEDGLARQRNIKVGLRQGERVEVLAGLNPGDMVVVRGQNRLYDGAAVSLAVIPGAQKEKQQ